MRGAWLLALVAALGGCSRIMGYSDAGRSTAPIRQYPDGPDGLKAFFGDVLEAARKDDRDRVHDLLATTVMSDEDLAALFGPRAAALAPRYHRLMETLVNRGSVELVAEVYERKFDTVEAVVIEQSGPIVEATPYDRAVARALVAPVTLYAVRVVKAPERRGLRYDFFFYRRGKWLTGNQLGRYLDEPAFDAGAAR
jgi:hypothetical protein